MRQRFLFLMAGVWMAAGCAQGLPPASPPIRDTTLLPTVSPLIPHSPVIPTPAEGMARIRGVITQVRHVGNVGAPALEIRVAASPQGGRGRDLAVVVVTKLASVTIMHEGQRTRTSLESLNVGQMVEVGLSSLMKPANPVQASALEVTILE